VFRGFVVSNSVCYVWHSLTLCGDTCAHPSGAGLPYEVVLGVHTFPELMQSSCTTVSAWGTATPKGEMLAVRALDWDTSGVLQNFPALLIYHPMPAATGVKEGGPTGQAFASLAWTGFVGMLTGRNEAGLSLVSGCCWGRVRVWGLG
jgi:hypothetical protein